MVAKIPIEDLNLETKKKLKLSNNTISPKLVALGKVLQDLAGLTNREGIWTLKTALNHIRGYREKGTRA